MKQIAEYGSKWTDTRDGRTYTYHDTVCCPLYVTGMYEGDEEITMVALNTFRERFDESIHY